MSQIAFPVKDLENIGWSPTSPVYSRLDNPTRSPVTPESTTTPEGDTFTVGLRKLYPPNDLTPMVLSIALAATGSDPVVVIVDLLENAAVITSGVFQPISSTFETKTISVSAGQASRIQDFGDLRVRVTAHSPNTSDLVTSCGRCPGAVYAPRTWKVAVHGLTSINCANCGLYNSGNAGLDGWVLTYQNSCYWRCSGYWTCYGAGSYLELRYITENVPEPYWWLQFEGVPYGWKCPSEKWNCFGPNEMTLLALNPGTPDTSCSNWPPTVTIYPG
jgi:hypothetical protein